MKITKKELAKMCWNVYKVFFPENDIPENEFVEKSFGMRSAKQIQTLFDANNFDISLLFRSMVYMRDFPVSLQQEFVKSANELHMRLLIVKLMFLTKENLASSDEYDLPIDNKWEIVVDYFDKVTVTLN